MKWIFSINRVIRLTSSSERLTVLWLFLTIPSLICCKVEVQAAETDSHVYLTGNVMEIDRCASAWLLKNHIDRSAQFKLLSDEQLQSSKGIQFDTPYAQLRRTHRFSTFESIQLRYGVKDARVSHIAKLIHEIEINFWNKRKNRQTTRFEVELKMLLNRASTTKAALSSCFSYLDNLTISIE